MAAGLISVLYRYALSFAESGLMSVIEKVKGNAVLIVLWFVLLAVIGFAVSMINKWEPMASGSGMPQVNGEIKGNLTSRPVRIIAAKFFGRNGVGICRFVTRKRGAERSARRNGSKDCCPCHKGG